MKLLLPILSLLSLTTAVPSERRQSSTSTPDAFTLNIRWSNSPLKGPLNANAGSFWTGKPTSSFCPETVPGCKLANATSFLAQDGQLFLNTAVPGGQQVYISPQGQLTYTPPHSAAIPTGSLTNLVSWSGDSGDSFLNPFLTYWLCNTDADATSWSVWLEYTNGTTGSITNAGSDGVNACTRIALEAMPYRGAGAWEFS
ncbi:hypothetical protein FE257_001749 [Aspergillus nanangensis]|uniref:IgE-binding protein n=1 Tax=Aspergillus nanangensis TaxID=2582783 RepID=A0AAD4GQL0_ASPNN|nr:hypothetical protein FE257_001749 [Aspergillus nanangensis]